MDVYKEQLLSSDLFFPVEVFISNNLEINIDVPYHYHDCIEILYVLNGNAIQIVNNKHYDTKKNDIIIINPGDIHSTQCNSNEDCQILVVKFLPDIISVKNIHSFESKYIFNFLNSSENRICHLDNTVNNFNNIYNVMLGIYKEFTIKELGYEILLKGYIYQLIAYMLRSGFISNNYQTIIIEKQLKTLDPFLKFIENNYKETINLKDGAKLLNFNYYYLSRYFKKTTGRNFKEYLDFIRICEAEQLIMSQNVTITQVAYEVGFSSVSAFCRAFKRIKNYSPGSLKRAKNV